MGRLVILALIIVTIVVLWKAFGPGSGARGNSGQTFGLRGRGQKQVGSKPAGPDDDPDFMWNIRKERFKQQREAEIEEEKRIEQARRRRLLDDKTQEDKAREERDNKPDDGDSDQL